MQCLSGLAARHQQAALRLLRQASILSDASSSQLLQQPGVLQSPSQLERQELESLAFVLGNADETYTAMARGVIPDALSIISSPAVDQGMKTALTKKIIAASGARATPILLAWAAEQIRSGLLQSVQAATDQASLYALPWHADVMPLAAAWALRGGAAAAAEPAVSAMTEQQALVSFLETPGALRWPQLLAMPSLQSILQTTSASQPVLQSTLVRLGLLSSKAYTTQAAAGSTDAQPASTGPADTASHSTSNTWSKADVTVHQLELEAKQYLMKRLGLSDSATRSPPVALSALVMQQKPAPPADQRVALAVLRLARHARAATGAELPQAAAITLQLLGCLPKQSTQAPLTFNMGQIQNAAGDLLRMAGLRKPPITGSPIDMSDSVVDSLLRAAVEADDKGAAAQFVKRIQAYRAQALVAGEPWALASATHTDISALTPTQVSIVTQHARKQAARGAQLAAQLLPPGAAAAAASPLLPRIARLPADDRAALAWLALRGELNPAGAAAGAAAATAGPARFADALVSEFTQRATGMVAETSASARVAADLAEVIAVERQAAELDYMNSRQGSLLEPPKAASTTESLSDPSTSGTQGAQALPTHTAMMAARAALPETDLLLFDLLYQDVTQPNSTASEAQMVAAFKALFGEGVSAETFLDAPETTENLAPPAQLSKWVLEAKSSLIAAPAGMLNLLARFLELRVARDVGAAGRARDGLRDLLREVRGMIETQNNSAQDGKDQGISPYWLSSEQRKRMSATDTETQGDTELSVEAITHLLGPLEGRQFRAFLDANALTADNTLTQMEHDPQLHMEWRAAPRPWTEVTPSHPPDGFLEQMKPFLDRYLEARGMRPVLDAEWCVYKDAALRDLHDTRVRHEAALRTQGHSAFFNTRAEAVYLKQLVTDNIPHDAPLAEQAHRYLTVLETNPSWTFQQKKRVVLRLIELSKYFAAQPPVSDHGSPFAPLFDASSGQQLVPTLKPWYELRAMAEQQETQPVARTK